MGTTQGLEDALASDVVKTITLTNDLTLTTNVAPKTGVTIDGGGNILTLNATSPTGGNTSAEGLFIQNDNVTIKDLKVTRTGTANTDNLVEIYGNNVKLDNVEVTNGAKNGIYVNNNGKGAWTVTFNKVKTSGNTWSGIGLAAQQANDAITANFTGINVFAEAVSVYTEGTNYSGSYTVTGLNSLTKIDAGTPKGENPAVESKTKQTWYKN